MSNPAKLIIISQPRTGSTLLCSLLNSCDEIRCLVEPINPTGHYHHMQPIRSNTIFPDEMVHHNINMALDILFSKYSLSSLIRTDNTASAIASFKIMIHQILALREENKFWQYLKDNRVKILLCFRRNIIMQYVSDLITTVTRQPACWDGDVRTARVTVDTKNLGRALSSIVGERQYLFKRLREFGLESKTVLYEDFATNHRLINGILKTMFGYEAGRFSTKLMKQNPDSLKDRVNNYNDLLVEVKKLGLEYLLVNRK